jgi:hypothetical protein
MSATRFLPAAASMFLAASAVAMEDHQHQVLGEVRLPVTCTDEAQAAFDHAMKLQHSFWHRAAVAAFEDVLENDPPA